MALNLNESWNGESLGDVRSFLQQQLQKGFVNVTTQTIGGEVVQTFTKGDGSKVVSRFASAETENEGVRVSLGIVVDKQYYSSGADVVFSYNYRQTLDGSELIGVAPILTFSVWTLDSSNNKNLNLYSTTLSDLNQNTVTIPKEKLQGYTGTLYIEGIYALSYQEVTYTNDPSSGGRAAAALFRIETCSLNYGAGFNLSRQIQGYEDLASTTQDTLEFAGSKEADILIYIDGTLRKTIHVDGTDNVSVGIEMDARDDAGGQILSSGLHTVQALARMSIPNADGSETLIYSNSLLWDFYKGILGNHVGVQFQFPSSDIIANPRTGLTLNTEEYTKTSITYAGSSYNSGIYEDATAITVYKNSTRINTLSVAIGTVESYTFRDTTTGRYNLTFETSSATRVIGINVKENSNRIKVATAGLLIDLSAAGRSNQENSYIRNVWTFNDNSNKEYTANLENFTFESSDGQIIDGWDGEALVFRGGTAMTIPYAPFASFNKTVGMYVEFNYRVDTIIDDNEYLIKCLNSNNLGGFYLKPSEAGIITTAGTEVKTPFMPGVTYNISFMVKPYTGGVYRNADGSETDATSTVTTLLELWINGIRTATTVITVDSFDTNAQINMYGGGAIWHFYGMRVYNAPLSVWDIFSNYVTTLSNATEIEEIVARNQVLNALRTDISSEALRKLGKSVLIIEAGNGTQTASIDSDGLAKLTSDCQNPSSTVTISTAQQILDPNAKKKQNYIAKSLTFYSDGSLEDPYSFKTGPTLLQVQGTSSTYYSRKNYDIFFAGQKYAKSDGSAWVASFDAEVGPDSHSYVNNARVAPRYSMSAQDQGVPCLCCKADYSDSSTLHNTVLTKMLNDAWISMGRNYWTPPMKSYDSNNMQVRVGINGRPIFIFIKDSAGQEQFIGQYNMNNEKKDSHHVYGFGDGAICIECLSNNTPATLFQIGSDSTTFNWSTCSSSVNEEGEPIEELEFRYPPQDWGDASNNEINKVKRLWTWIADCYKEWKDSYSESTGTYTSNKFVAEIKDYFNVYNLCAWYLYTDYFLAVDQRSKNMMLATWDGEIWYFLPYDSDTCLGVTNDGWLVIPWDADVDTPNPRKPAEYCFMGHDSYLWELVRFYLGDDTYTKNAEYGIVGMNLSEVAQALRADSTSTGGYTKTMINKSFDAFRSQRTELTYNYDSDTKYLAPLTYKSARGSESQFAQFVQGPRDAHRPWLIEKRFAFLDGKYGAGDFVTKVARVYLSTDTAISPSIKVTAATEAYLRIGVQNGGANTMRLQEGVETVFNLVNYRYQSNDPVSIQGAGNIKVLDFGDTAQYLAGGWQFSPFTSLQKLVMDGKGTNLVPQAANSIFASCPTLKDLTIKGYPGMTGILDLSSLIAPTRLDISLEGISDINMPKSTYYLQYANFGPFNVEIPWEFWDELDKRLYRPKGHSLVVMELISEDAVVNLHDFDYTNNPNANVVAVKGRYAAIDFPYPSLIPKRTERNGVAGLFEAQSSLKRLIYSRYSSTVLKAYNPSRSYDGLYCMFMGCTNLESVNTKGWELNLFEARQNTAGDNWDNLFFRNCNNLKEIDLSFVDTANMRSNHYTDRGHNNESYKFYNCPIEYIRFGANYFNCQITETGMVNQTLGHETLNAQTFIDLAEDLPDISNRTFNNDSYRELYFYNNVQNFTTLTQEVRDKITAKGWVISSKEY